MSLKATSVEIFASVVKGEWLSSTPSAYPYVRRARRMMSHPRRIQPLSRTLQPFWGGGKQAPADADLVTFGQRPWRSSSGTHGRLYPTIRTDGTAGFLVCFVLLTNWICVAHSCNSRNPGGFKIRILPKVLPLCQRVTHFLKVMLEEQQCVCTNQVCLYELLQLIVGAGDLLAHLSRNDIWVALQFYKSFVESRSNS